MKNESGGFSGLLRNGGFQSFLWTQFLGALNDNIYKLLVSMRAMHLATGDAGARYLTLAGAVYFAPFLLFSGYAGRLADSVSKRTVLRSVKVFEVGIMGLALAAFFSTRIEWMLAVLFLMGLHSTIFSPAKYGIVPEILPDRELSRANGLLEMTTFVAIVLGTSCGSFLFTAWKAEAWKMGVVTLGIAVAGLAVSFGIPRVAGSGAKRKDGLNPFAEIVTGTRHLLADRPQWLTVLGISYFWFLGALFQMDLLLFGSETLKASDQAVGIMVTCLSIGIGAGSLLAGKLSGDKVELGLVPLGALLMGLFSMALYGARTSYGWSVAALSLLGAASGLFSVPLNAFLQQRGERGEKGRLIATNNFYNTVGMLLASATLWGLHDRLHARPETLFLVFGLVTLASTVYIVSLVSDFLVRFMLWMLTHTFFKVRIMGQENVPFRGPALLVANHMSHVDGFLISACVQRFIRFLVWRPYYDSKAFHWFFKIAKAIPVGSGGPRDIVESIRRARKELQEGHVVCIFAEGAISRTGNLLPFKRGLEKITEGVDAPVIPVHLDRLWGSIFSFERGQFFWKWPKRIPYPVTVSFGRPMKAPAAQEVRQAITELGSEAAMLRKSRGDVLHLRFVHNARRNWSRMAMADSGGHELTYGKALTAGLMAGAWFRRQRRDDRMIAILLPPSVGGALANIGVTMAGKIPVNLNFTAGREAMASAMEQCGARTVVTSKTFLAKAGIEEPAGSVFIEDILAQATGWDKLRAVLTARLAPVWALRRGVGPDSMATVVFSSGSTGTPKGVMLSNYNIVSDIDAITQVFRIGTEDRVIGVLPFFHSFGFTVTIWFPLVGGCAAAYHPNPMDAKSIGALVLKYAGTFLLSTPTFCAQYVRKCSREEFATLRYVIAGAEKLRDSVAAAFEEKFGVAMLEGYGCTEMSPVVCVNAPDFEAGQERQVGRKRGTVGQPLPGIAVKVDGDGGLLVKGPTCMLGYLGQPERTAEVMRDGWYVTGDIAAIDEEGFVKIIDRVSRFSKIGGEMVPHLKVEEAIYGIASEHACAVVGIPDEQRGERLVALYTSPAIEPAELWRKLSETDLPNLWVPKRENIHRVESLPALGSGKLDLRGVKALAMTVALNVS